MTIDLPLSHPIRTVDLTGRRERAFDLRPDAAQLLAMAPVLDVTRVDDVVFTGVLRPSGQADVILEGRLKGRAQQPCVVTLAPVTTHIDTDITRRYIAGMELPGDAEAEMPEDDTIEPLPQIIDLGAVLLEALALALPDYPRAEGAELGEAVFAAANAEPLRDADLKPFAALAALKKPLDHG